MTPISSSPVPGNAEEPLEKENAKALMKKRWQEDSTPPSPSCPVLQLLFLHVGSELTTVQHQEVGHGLPCLREHLSSRQASISTCTSITPQAYSINRSLNPRATHTLTNLGLVPLPIGEKTAGHPFLNFAGCSQNICILFNKWLRLS